MYEDEDEDEEDEEEESESILLKKIIDDTFFCLNVHSDN
jgi:hypothetical protein